MKYKITYEIDDESKRNQGDDQLVAMKDIEDAINKVGLDEVKKAAEMAIMEMALEEMDSFDGYDECEDDDELDEFQLEVSHDTRTNCDTAAGEEVGDIVGIRDWDRICYIGTMMWHWRAEGYEYNSWSYDWVTYTVEVE